MKLSKGKENLNLPEYIKFGLELEVENLDTSKIKKRIEAKNWKAEKDASLTDGGTECVSPVLMEKEDSSVWEEVEDICNNIKESPRDTEREAYTDHTCGGHIHFDTQIFRKNPEIMKNFLRLWAESEELIYKMCNEKGDPIRESAMEASHVKISEVGKALLRNPLPKNTKISNIKDCIKLCKTTGLNMLTNITNATNKLNVVLNKYIEGKHGMAHPRAVELMEKIEKGTLKVGTPKKSIFRNIVGKYKLNGQRYNGLNLSNQGVKGKDTIEFRMSNGTINPDTIKENVFLYASIIKTAVDMTERPNEMQEKLKKFYNRDVTEEEKVNAFLELIMDSEEDRNVYKERWESVKDNPVYSQTKGSKMFLKEAFKREDLRQEAEKQPVSKLQEAFSFISNLKDKIKGKENSQKEDTAIEY